MDKRSVAPGTPGFLTPSLLPRGLREKLIVSFSLMSVIPLLVLAYIVSIYVFPKIREIGNLSLVIALASGIALLGLAVMRGFVLPVVRLASDARAIAEGQLDREVGVQGPDEVGSIGSALNQITQRVRDNMSQLRTYGEQTKQLNLEINRRILTLSHVLQVSNLISQSAKIEEVMAFILEKLTQVEEAELNCLLEVDPEEDCFLVKSCSGLDLEQAQALQGVRFSSAWLAGVLQGGRAVVVDRGQGTPQAREFLDRQFGMSNAVLQPVVSMRQGIALLLSANRRADFYFQEDCLDLLRVFGKQVSIAIENDLLTRRAEQLKVIDELTGLYNAGYMTSRLEEEVRRAARYHRPCSLILLDLDDFEKLQQLYGALAVEGVLHQLAELLKGQATEVDRVGRMGPDLFAMILPERNKREAIELAESIRRRIEQHAFSNGPNLLPCSLRLCAAVSENPLDGASGEELFAKASSAMRSAKSQGKNKVLAA